MDWPVLLRRLPRFIAPFRDETTSSYLARLATANRHAPAALRALLAGSYRNDAPVPLIGLAAVTGMPRAALAHAMPQICTADELAGLHIASRPRARDGWSVVACRHCAAGRLVTRWALHDDVVCGRHRRWISKDQAQPDLTAQPEILTAHRRHQRLIRRHGRDTVMRAFRDARHICLGCGHRMEIFHGPDWRDRDDDENQTSDAAAYPQAVALTRLLASPYWRDEVPRGFRTVHPIGWTLWKGK
jgi:TniQ